MDDEFRRNVEKLHAQLAQAEVQADAWKKARDQARAELISTQTAIQEQKETIGLLTEQANSAKLVCERQYREIIQHVFARPSRRSALITVLVSTISVVVSIVVTAYYSTNTAAHSETDEVAASVATNEAAASVATNEVTANFATDPSTQCASIVLGDMLAYEPSPTRWKHFKTTRKEISRWRTSAMGDVEKWGTYTTVDDIEGPYIAAES